MRKSRTVVSDADEVITDFINDHHGAFKLLEKLEIVLPDWAEMLFVFARKDKKRFDVSYFEDAKDFFLWYSKVLITQKDLQAISFTRKDAEWLVFVPPTLIGVNLRTRLR